MSEVEAAHRDVERTLARRTQVATTADPSTRVVVLTLAASAVVTYLVNLLLHYLNW